MRYVTKCIECDFYDIENFTTQYGGMGYEVKALNNYQDSVTLGRKFLIIFSKQYE